MRTLLLAFVLAATPLAFGQEAPPAAPPAAATPPPPPPAEAKVPETKPPAETEAKIVEPDVPYAWELDLFVGYGQVAYPGTDFADVAWSNGGPGVAVDIAYRGPHFTHPFFELSYVPVLASGRDVNVYDPSASNPAVGTVYAKNYATAVGFLIGPGWDVDWFRARLGIGFYDYEVKTYLGDSSSSVSQVGLGFLASVAAFVWRPEPFALGIEARWVALQSPLNGIYQTMWEIGLTGRWDFVNHK